MVITHLGGQCFKITFGDLTLVFDPISKNSSLSPVRFGANIALISRNHPDMNGAAEVAFGGKEPFVISGPGEYEKEGITIQGFLTSSQYGLGKDQDTAINTIYAVKLEGMTLVFLGALDTTSLPSDAKEAIDEVDILFVPVGGDGVLSPAEGSKIATMLQPKVVIPMHWSGMGEANALDQFLKEAGDPEEKADKLTLKKKDLADKDGAIMVVTP